MLGATGLLLLAAGVVWAGRNQQPGHHANNATDLRLGAPFTDHMVVQLDRPVRVWGWDRPGQAVRVDVGGHAATAHTDAEGFWRVTLPALTRPGPLGFAVRGSSEAVLDDVVGGDVWWCSGQSNMEWPLKRSEGLEAVTDGGPRADLRVHHVPARASDAPAHQSAGRWARFDPERPTATGGTGTSAVAWFFADALLKVRPGRPIGVVVAARGGSNLQAWVSPETAEATTSRAALDTLFAQDQATYERQVARWHTAGRVGEKPWPANIQPHHRWSHLYHGMTTPYVGLTVRGVLWYQGEANVRRPEAHTDLFARFIEQTRGDFADADLPFLFVQLPAYESPWHPWQAFRESQRRSAATLPNVHMAVVTDAGEAEDLHPPDKATVGERLALLARRHVYGEDVTADAPEPREVHVDGDVLRIRFRNVGDGLESLANGGGLRGFDLIDQAGASHAVPPVDARVEDAQTVRLALPPALHASTVRELRYGYMSVPPTDLRNSVGLPAGPFCEPVR